ncbi:MAG: glycosyl transferase group 1 [Bacteroidetes bacterium]|uniref:glycosyltransferase n=1 Tax=unclassified Chitinophaga TaxID=2619133 RepID=UPI0009D0535C|nr:MULTISPECIES: glycosyltransferase [unclassified Chitinophaga]MBP1650322.1 glycosyl transferase group 1 [Bacteroidota bacterium]OMP77836.1 hypothetical protein BW716_18125 [[Flexibacter] sp. ATCC 35208]WPV68988.1 glycosyltransferase [Chitinophaga sp. LS1]
MTADKKPGCLLLISKLPYPPVGGDRVKNYNLIRILSRYYALDLVVITEEKPDEASVEFMQRYTNSCKVFLYPKWRFYINALVGLLGKEPIQVSYYYFREVQKYVDGLQEQAAIVIANLIRTAKYVNTSKAKVLDINDSLAINYKRSIGNVSSLFWKTIYRLEVNRLFAFEQKCIEQFGSTLFVNESEYDYWKDKGNVHYVPFGVDDKLFSYNQYDMRYSNAITFFGKMDYQPNVDTVVWFAKNVLEKLDPGIKFIIVGARPSNEVLNLSLNYKNLEVTGFVEDPYLIIASSFLSVAPMQTGAGLQNKVLEAMALGQVVLTNQLAAKPIMHAEDNKHLLLAETPDEIADRINEIFRDRNKYAHIGQNARELMSRYYTLQCYEQKVMNVLNTVAH